MHLPFFDCIHRSHHLQEPTIEPLPVTEFEHGTLPQSPPSLSSSLSRSPPPSPSPTPSLIEQTPRPKPKTFQMRPNPPLNLILAAQKVPPYWQSFILQTIPWHLRRFFELDPRKRYLYYNQDFGVKKRKKLYREALKFIVNSLPTDFIEGFHRFTKWNIAKESVDLLDLVMSIGCYVQGLHIKFLKIDPVLQSIYSAANNPQSHSPSTSAKRIDNLRHLEDIEEKQRRLDSIPEYVPPKPKRDSHIQPYRAMGREGMRHYHQTPIPLQFLEWLLYP